MGLDGSIGKSSSGFIEVKLVDKEIERNQPTLPLRRRALLELYPDTVDVTISVVAYNRLETTKECVESILKYTTDIRYKLILVYNESEQGEGILDYFQSVDYDNKLVIYVNKNAGLALATKEILKHIEGKYYVGLANDMIVTKNWLTNLIKCAESDVTIGMVAPVSSNVTNMQKVDLPFFDSEEMQEEAAKFNVSNPQKWEERLRLVTIAPLITRDCMEAIGNMFDLGFFHDFSDDELSFRIRRAGYKCMLAGDTWVHHDHDPYTRDPAKLGYSMQEGIKNFKEKYLGLDSWRDTNNLHMEYVNAVCKCEAVKPRILGIDVKCGAPILQIKNKLRSYGIFNAELYAHTQNVEYCTDLLTICGQGNVTCGTENDIATCYIGQKFDYIVVGEEINKYSNPIGFIKKLSELLNPDGQLFISLKNTDSILSLLNLLGYSNVQNNDFCVNISNDYLCNKVKEMGLDIRHILSYIHVNTIISREEMEQIQETLLPFAKVSSDELRRRLLADCHAYVIKKC